MFNTSRLTFVMHWSNWCPSDSGFIWSRPSCDVIKWKHFSRHWPFVRGIHRWPVNSPHKGQWRGALMFSLILAWINGWANNREAGDLRRHRAHYDVAVMWRIANSTPIHPHMQVAYIPVDFQIHHYMHNFSIKCTWNGSFSYTFYWKIL